MSWQSTWSTQQQRYCCYLRGIGCHTKVGLIGCRQTLMVSVRWYTGRLEAAKSVPEYGTETSLPHHHQDQAGEGADACAGAPSSCASDHACAERAHQRVLAGPVLVEWAQDAPQVIKVPTPGPPHVAPRSHDLGIADGFVSSFTIFYPPVLVLVLKRCPSTSTRSTSCPCQSQARLSTTPCQCR